ncbi:hypothetical protein [Rikenella microfusus]|uniref:hypothetical protein n=1 Tax=Rikenella microfusus TaxID=28139 RepID=UPI003A9064AE
MNIEEILLMSLLAATIAFMLLRPFVVRRPAPHPVRRAGKTRRTVRAGGVRSLPPVSRARNRAYDPRHAHLHIRAVVRKMPPLRHWVRHKNNEAYSHR